MSADTDKYLAETETETRHSAFDEFNRDERRPALLLLSALAIAVLFFTLGIIVGRWMGDAAGGSQSNSSLKEAAKPAPDQSNAQPKSPSANSSSAIAPANTTTSDPQRRFSLLVATFNAPEDAQPLIKKLERAGYKDVRTNTPRGDESKPKFSVLVGHYTRDEAREALTRMRSTDDSKLKNARVIETPVN